MFAALRVMWAGSGEIPGDTHGRPNHRPRDDRRAAQAQPSSHPRVVLLTLSDDILHKVRARDTSAFDEIWRVAGPHLLRYAAVMTNSRSVAEDVVQETMLLLWNRAPTLEPRGTLAEWLLATVRNIARGERRSDMIAARSIARVAAERSDGSSIAKDPDNIEHVIEQNDLATMVRRRIAGLNEHQRLAVQL